MKYTFILLSFLIFSCTTKQENNTATAKPAPKIEQTFPFSQVDKIEAISYPVSDMRSIVKDGKLLSDSIMVKERIVLKNDEVKKIFDALYVDEPEEEISSPCFEPRHALLFYEKDSIIANLQICFTCGTAVGNFKHNYYNLGRIYHIFQKAGIKYFGEENK